MHQIDTCTNITMKNVTCIGGSDGVHLHHCENILIEDCIFHTGDDCIAGINMKNLLVKNCDINTSCQAFRAGGVGIHIENCRIWGPGMYPHRMTVVQNRWTELVRDKKNTLPQNEGRHNLVSVFLHFASMDYPNPVPFGDVVFKNCTVENVDKFLTYHADLAPLEAGTHLTDIRLENVTFKNVLYPSDLYASETEPLTVTLKNVAVSFCEGADNPNLFDGKDVNTKIIYEK